MSESTRTPEPAVVVGFDGSNQALTAVRWAASEAASRGRPLVVVEAVGPPGAVLSPTPGATLPPGDTIVDEQVLHAGAERRLAEIVAETRRHWPALAVDARALAGRPSSVLTSVAETAELVVVGASGHTALPRMLLGSTAAELAHRCTRPVVVVRNAEESPRGGRVVVGVDGSGTSTRAIGFAFDFAHRHGHELVAVHAWSDLPMDALAPVRMWDENLAELREEGELVLAESLGEHQQRYPDVAVRRWVTFEPPSRALATEAEGAALLVVGSHGRGALRRALLGSVSHAMTYHAPCPVAVLRAAARD